MKTSRTPAYEAEARPDRPMLRRWVSGLSNQAHPFSPVAFLRNRTHLLVHPHSAISITDRVASVCQGRAEVRGTVFRLLQASGWG